MKIIKIILAILVIILGINVFINPSAILNSIMLFFLGALLLTMAQEELKKPQKSIGYLLIIVACLDFFVVIKGLLT